jgi:hypothetical protein
MKEVLPRSALFVVLGHRHPNRWREMGAGAGIDSTECPLVKGRETMILATLDGGMVIGTVLLAYIAWVLYMATFRTKDFLDLMEQDRQRKRDQAERFGRATKTGFSIAKWFMSR